MLEYKEVFVLYEEKVHDNRRNFDDVYTVWMWK